MKLVFSHPERKKTQLPVIPVFMPFAGCRVRCIFCSQTAQTGKNERNLSVILGELEDSLRAFAISGRGPVEVAFYGGTFTALSVADQAQCLDLTQRWREKGLVKKVRCSTRPDCIDKDTVGYLRERGVSLIELGVQSFCDVALTASKRNYTAGCVQDACRTIREGGLELGIQLMPGLPGASLEDSYDDILLTVTQKPACVRLYPCLVFAGTPLAELWGKGGYAPLPLGDTVQLLAYACRVFWEHDISVIRMGVAPEPSAMSSLLAGPFHYSLGSMVRGQALFDYVADKVRQFANFEALEAAESGGQRNQGDLENSLKHMGQGGPVSQVSQVGQVSQVSQANVASRENLESQANVEDQANLESLETQPNHGSSVFPETSRCLNRLHTLGARHNVANPYTLNPYTLNPDTMKPDTARPDMAKLDRSRPEPSGAARDTYGGQSALSFRPAFILRVPQKFQGEFWGFKGCLKDKYASLGLSTVLFHEGSEFYLETDR